MKTVILTRYQASLLSNQLERKVDGFTVKQLRQLNKILDKFEEPLKEYRKQVKEMSDNYQKKLASVEQEIRGAVVIEYNKLTDEWNKAEGIKEDSYEFEDGDFDFLKELWSKTNGFMGIKEARDVILKIDDALQGAV